MEEAHVSGTDLPSVVTTDDLLMLIGARTVEALNYERLLKEALKQAQAANDLQKRIGELEKTVRALSDQNASLDRALTEARQQAQIAAKQAEEAENRRHDIERSRATLEGKLAAAQDEIEKLREEIAALSKKKKKK